jgi:hypothetical protein
MRTRLLVLLACLGACVGTALVALPTAHADSPPPGDTDWSLCSGPSDDYCVWSSQRKTAVTPYANVVPGVDITDGDVPRDYPWVKGVTGESHLMVFGVWRDVFGHGGTLDNDVDPAYTYRLVVRTGTFFPREMTGIMRNADYVITRSPTGGWQFTVTFQPTAVHHAGIGPGECSVYGPCVSDSTNATWDVPGFASGAIEDLAVSGLDASEISQRTGMFRTTSAQDEDVVYDPDTNALVVRLANPHRTASGTLVTDGTYDAFIPNRFLIGTMNVPDPSMLTGFTVTKSVGGTTTPASAAFTFLPGRGVLIRISGISFSKPTYRLVPRATPPGRPRAVVATKIAPHKAKVRFAKPLLNGGRAIGYYQARCRKATGGIWHYDRRSVSPVYVDSLRIGRQVCQVRAHNVKGFGLWSALDRT